MEQGTASKYDKVVVQHKFNRWDFDTAGTVSMWTLTLHIVGLTYQAKVNTFFKPPSHGHPSTDAYVIRSQNWEIFPPYYKSFGVESILTVTIKMLNVGRTSFTIETEISDTSTTEVLVRNVAQYINVGMDTRRPKSFPDWVNERFGHLTSRPRPTTAQVFERPAFTTPFIYSVRIPPSHINWLNHVGQNYYVNYCFDCAALGSRKGVYSTVSGDIAKYKIREVSVLYQKEALEGDVISVESWEDEDSPGTLKFQVKKGSDDIVQMAIAFDKPSVCRKQASKM